MSLRNLLILGLAVALPTAAQAAQNASPATPRAVVEAMFSAFNRHHLTGLVSLYAAEARLTSSDFCRPRVGHEGVRRTYSSLFEAFPDITDTLEAIVVEGDRVAVRFTARSAIEGRAFSLPIMTFITVRDGLIVTDDSLFDTHGQPCRD